MKKKRYHIFCAWLLVICFAAGQYMVYAHRHNGSARPEKLPQSSKQAIKERCNLCDVMHHNAMLASAQVKLDELSFPGLIYRNSAYHFKSIQPVLTAGRAPPAC